jgi:CRISPR-associated protein Cmr2
MLVENEAYNSRAELTFSPEYNELHNQIKGIVQQCIMAPYPYVATLVADGDRMGASLRQIKNSQNLRQFSSSLGQFANAARRIVEQECSGSLLYAGGDDVVAFAPLATAIDCAVKLRKAFEEVMQPGIALPSDWPSNHPDYALPSLSVGISIGHVLSGMGNLLEGGRIAERIAKGSDLDPSIQRNALAVRADKRSGGTMVWRCRWDSNKAPEDQLRQAISRLSRQEQSVNLPSTKVAEVRRDLARFPKPGTDETNTKKWAQFLSHDILRTLGRASLGLGGCGAERSDDASRLQRLAENYGLPWPMPIDYRTCHQVINDWITLHLIAREFVRGTWNTIAQTGEVA